MKLSPSGSSGVQDDPQGESQATPTRMVHLKFNTHPVMREIKCIVGVWNACYHLVQTFLTSWLLPKT
jgi:hypothetical protein